ncbi:MAG: TfoX/Sxy family protein [Pseudomonadota bacterium]
MTYDEVLSQRMRDALDGLPAISEKKMMGGVCFLINGNMVGGAHRDKKTGIGNFMFRVGKDNETEAIKVHGAGEMIMGERKMGGFVQAEEEIENTAFTNLVSLAVSFAGSLPPK